MFFNGGKKYKKKHQRRLEDQLGPALSIISIGARWEGTLNGKNSVKISGLLEGDVTSEMLVWIAKGGRVEGTIKARGVIVEGEVNGNIDSKEKAELRSGGRIIGDISCKKLSVAEDSFFDGKIKMDESQEQPYTFVAKRNNKK
jgi:cytoskeletal protein CcmA (bactofilin family)